MNTRNHLLCTFFAFLTGGLIHAQTPPVVVLAPGISWHAETGMEPRGDAPINDECSTVSEVVLPIGGSINFTGDNTGATAAYDFVPGSSLETVGPCVWHKFTTSACTNITVSYCATSPAFTGVVAFLSPGCPAGDDYQSFFTYNYDECGNGNGTIYYVSVPAGTWYLPVMMNTFTNSIGPYSIQVSSTACPTPPANDDCENAAPLIAGPWCSFTTYTTGGATESQPAIVCGEGAGFANDDVWFSFTATSSTMSIGARGMDDGDGEFTTGFDAVLELFSGPCDNLVSMDCADDSLWNQAEEITATGLTIGTTYYVRVYDRMPGYPAVPEFGICLVDGPGINIGMDDLILQEPWSLYPNPGNGTFRIQVNGAEGTAQLDVLDLSGRMVRTSRTTLTTGSGNVLDLVGLASKTYLVRLTRNGIRNEKRLIVD